VPINDNEIRIHLCPQTQTSLDVGGQVVQCSDDPYINYKWVWINQVIKFIILKIDKTATISFQDSLVMKKVEILN